MNAQRVEGFALVLVVVGVAAGAASFTHVHDWTMQHSPAGTPGWFGWANACISELVPVAALLDIRRRRRASQSPTRSVCWSPASACRCPPSSPSPNRALRAGCCPRCRPWRSWPSPSWCSPAPRYRGRPVPRSPSHHQRRRYPRRYPRPNLPGHTLTRRQGFGPPQPRPASLTRSRYRRRPQRYPTKSTAAPRRYAPDAELLAILDDPQRVPRNTDGTVPVKRAAKVLGTGPDRARRLLGEAGLRQPAPPARPDQREENSDQAAARAPAGVDTP